MNNKELLLVLTGGLTRSVETAPNKPVSAVTIFLSDSAPKDGCWIRSRYITNPIFLPEDYLFMYTPGFRAANLLHVAVDVTNTVTRSNLERILGPLEPVIRMTKKGKPYTSGLSLNGQFVAKATKIDWRNSDLTRYTVKLINLSSAVKAKLVSSAMKSVGLKVGAGFPTYTGWMTNRDNEGVLNQLVSLQGDMFADICRKMLGEQLSDQDINVLRIRAGKDGWSEILSGLEKVKVLVVPEELAKVDNLVSSDGVMYLNNSTILSAGDHALGRGMVRTPDGKLGIFKGRMVHSPEQASVGLYGCQIPSTFDGVSIDGWCTSSVIKWAKIDFSNGPVVIEMKVGVTKVENHEQKEAYKLNLIHLILGRWDEPTKRDILSMLKHEAFSKVAALNDLKGTMYKRLDSTWNNDANEYMIDSALSRYVLGYLKPTDPKVISSLNGRVKALMSASLRDSVYAAVLYQETYLGVDGKVHTLSPGEFAPTKATREAIQSGLSTHCMRTGEWEDALTLTRHPVTGPSSYLSMTMAKCDIAGVTGLVVICGPEAAVAHQGDCDDHLHIACGHRSLTTVFNAPSCVDKSATPADGVLTDLSALWQGPTCQNSTSILVAAYYKTMAIVYDNNPELLDAVLQELLPLAQSIQDSVQGIKKFVGLTIGVNEVYDFCDSVLANRGLSGNHVWSPSAVIIAGKIISWYPDAEYDLREALSTVYQVNLNPDKVLDREELFHHSSIEKEYTRLCSVHGQDEMARRMASYRTKGVHLHLAVVDHLLEKVVGTSRAALIDHPELIDTLDTDRIKKAITLYAVYVHYLYTEGDVAAVRGMNGLPCLLAERLLS